MNHSSSMILLSGEYEYEKDETPVVKITGSHQESVLFGAIPPVWKENNSYSGSTIGLMKIPF
jgi:hypothetical protein